MEAKQRTARMLTHRLSSNSTSTSTSTSSTLSEIRLLSKHDPEIRLLFSNSGLVPILTNLILLPPTQNQENEEIEDLNIIQENACATLLNLSITAPESLMSTPSLLPSLSVALRSSSYNPALPPLAAATLYSLLTVDAYRPIIGSKHPLISLLISLLTLKSATTRSLKDSLKALFALALYPLNRPTLVSLNAVPPLFSLLVQSNRTGIMEDASAVIAQVAGCYECVDAFRKVGGVSVLVRMVGAGVGMSERVRENAASALLNLAMSGGEKAVGDIREVEVAEEVVREMTEKGKSERGKRKAEELLRVLESGRGSFCRLMGAGHQQQQRRRPYEHDDNVDDKFDGFTTTITTTMESRLQRSCSSDSSGSIKTSVSSSSF